MNQEKTLSLNIDYVLAGKSIFHIPTSRPAVHTLEAVIMIEVITNISSAAC